MTEHADTDALHAHLHAQSKRKTLVGIGSGNAMEWFDWNIYATFAAFFASQFFHSGDAVVDLDDGVTASVWCPAQYRSVGTPKASITRSDSSSCSPSPSPPMVMLRNSYMAPVSTYSTLSTAARGDSSERTMIPCFDHRTIW